MSDRVSFELSASNQFLSDLFEEALDDAAASADDAAEAEIGQEEER